MKKNLHTPEGVRDIYKLDCKNKVYVQDRLRENVESYGFQGIQTPTFEYVELFSEKVGSKIRGQLYQFFDREGNALALRPDITPSIARVSASVLQGEEGPYKFSYMGNVFSNTNSYQGRLKETTQMGVEYIGNGTIDADAEIIAMAVSSLQSVGLEEFQVSVGHVSYLTSLLEAAHLTYEVKIEVQDLLLNRNYFAVDDVLCRAGVADSICQAFQALPEMIGGREVIALAREHAVSREAMASVERLEAIASILELYGVLEYITFDFTMTGTYQYYTGIIFRGYTFGLGEAIVKGGRYDTLLKEFGSDLPAIGFAIVVDDVLNALYRQGIKLPEERKGSIILYDECRRASAVAMGNAMRRGGSMDGSRNGSITEVLIKEEKSLEGYIAYSKEKLAKVLLYFRADQTIEVINLITDERKIVSKEEKEALS